MAGPNLEESALTITGPQCRAARALVQWPRDQVARLSGLTEKTIEDYEKGLGRLDAAAMNGAPPVLWSDQIAVGGAD